PLAFRTADGGRSWQGISGNLPADGPVKVVREDPHNPDLLYAGTEFGLFASLDRGRTWVRFGELPTVAVDDILVHPRDNDLVVATHGRSLYVVEDVGPLQGLPPEVQGREAFLFPPRPAFGRPRLEDWAGSRGTSGFFKGANPPEGVLLTVYVKEFSGEPLEILIKNAVGVPVAKFKVPAAPGFNRLSWDLKPSKELLTEYGGEGPRLVRPGEYTGSLSYRKIKQEQKLTVEIAPGVETR